MDQLSQALLEMDLGITKKHKNTYHWASQKYQLELLGKYQGLYPSIRTLNRRRRKLEDGHYIHRQQRHRRDKNGKFSPGSTLTHVCARAFYHMARILKKALKIFKYHRMPKMAHNLFKTEDYSAPVDNWALLGAKLSIKGVPAAVFRTA